MQLAHLLAAEAAADATRIEVRRHDLARQRGVAWSGLGPDPITPRSPEVLRAAAESRLTARRLRNASPEGQILAAISACQSAAHKAHAVGERIRAGVAREEPPEWRRRVLQELAEEVRALASGLTDARAAIDQPDGAA